MAVVWTRETARDRSLELQREDGDSAGRSWLVRVDDPATTLKAIQESTNVSIDDAHPTEPGLNCERISVRAADDTGLLYVVTADYTPLEADSSSGSGEGSGDDGESEVEGKFSQWSGSSSVASEPVFLDRDGNVMTNSAGDPLEGLEAEKAQFHLTYTTFYNRHNDGPGPVVERGWVPLARRFTNAVNGIPWNGGQPGQWKCQGCSAKLDSDRNGADGALRFFWEVTWDFAFRADYWALRPWDIGFNELVDENGDPAPTYGISTGDVEDEGRDGSGSDGPCEGNLNRRAIKGADGKPVRQPVALLNGVAKAPCLRPEELWFEVYPLDNPSGDPEEPSFNNQFGEVRTPGL